MSRATCRRRGVLLERQPGRGSPWRAPTGAALGAPPRSRMRCAWGEPGSCVREGPCYPPRVPLPDDSQLLEDVSHARGEAKDLKSLYALYGLKGAQRVALRRMVSRLVQQGRLV